MDTVWALYASYTDADRAVREMVSLGIGLTEVTIVLRKDAATQYLGDQDLNELEAVRPAGDRLPPGLDLMLVGRQPANFSDAGTLLVVGRLAPLVGTVDGQSNRAPGNLGLFLEDFGVPTRTAGEYVDAIRQGQILFGVGTQQLSSTVIAAALGEVDAVRIDKLTDQEPGKVDQESGLGLAA